MEILSRHDLAKALRSSNASERKSSLETLTQAFAEAQDQGTPINQDALDELYLCYSENGIDRTWYAYLLLSLRNKYSIAVAKNEFLCSKNNKILLLAATHIARLPAQERIVFLSPLVVDASSAVRCRAAANMLDDCFDRLEPPVALRAAIISDHALPLPSLSADTLGIWLAELDGPYPDSAKNALLQSGAAALESMLTFWPALPLRARVWVMRTAAARNMAAVGPRLKETIRDSQDRELVVVALECMKMLGIDDAPLAASLYEHDDSLIRAAAIAAGNATIDWPDRFVSEKSECVRLAILEQIGRLNEVGYVGFLVRCLKDQSWRVRARATDALVCLAPASLESLRTALGDADEQVRVAAAQGLYRLGKEEWIRADLQTAALHDV